MKEWEKELEKDHKINQDIGLESTHYYRVILPFGVSDLVYIEEDEGISSISNGSIYPKDIIKFSEVQWRGKEKIKWINNPTPPKFIVKRKGKTYKLLPDKKSWGSFIHKSKDFTLFMGEEGVIKHSKEPDNWNCCNNDYEVLVRPKEEYYAD